MAVPYHTILRSVSIRTNSLIGADEGSLEISYTTTPLIEAQFDGADFPYTAHKDAVLDAEGEFAWAIADTGNHPWRSNISNVTPVIANAGDIPATDNVGNKIIGVFGAVYDSSDAQPLLPSSLDHVRRVNRLTTGMPAYLYCIDGRRIYHTRTNVTIEVCSYNRAVQLTALNANGAMLLPDVLAPGIIARAVSLLTRDDALANQAKIYRDYSNEALEMIRKGLTSVPPKSLPYLAQAA